MDAPGSPGPAAAGSGTARRTTKLLAVLAAIVLAAVAGALIGVAAQAATTGSAPINRFDAVDEIVNECTTTSTFKLVPQMRRSFTVPGTTDERVVVLFQGALSLSGAAGGFDTGFLRLTIDGVEQQPGEIPAIGEGERGTHGFNWKTAPLDPGAHVARVQWRTDLGESLCADARSLIVMHK